jgi:hypothetical protein
MDRKSSTTLAEKVGADKIVSGEDAHFFVHDHGSSLWILLSSWSKKRASMSIWLDLNGEWTKKRN